MISAPRPSCPPVRRITATKDEEENAMEYGLPSSHTLNTVCLSGYVVPIPPWLMVHMLSISFLVSYLLGGISFVSLLSGLGLC